jgi:gliding motility-associated-like protein
MKFRHFTVITVLLCSLYNLVLNGQDCPVIDASALKIPCYKSGTCPGTMTAYNFNPPQTGWTIVGGSFNAIFGNPTYCALLNTTKSTLTYASKNCGVSDLSFDCRKTGPAGTINFVAEVNAGNGWVTCGSGSTSSNAYTSASFTGINLYGDNVQVRVRITSREDPGINLLVDNFSINDYSLTGTITVPGCNVCSGEELILQALVSGISGNSQIDWYESASNPPYPGGTLIGSSTITTTEIPNNELEPGEECPKLVSIFIDACNGSGQEQDNEFVILTSGSGFSVPDLSIDIPNNNGPSANGDIGPGSSGPCHLQAPSAALWANMSNDGCGNIYQGNPSQTIPPNAYVLVFTSVNENVDYDLSTLCGLGYDIYIFQSDCARTQGAFVNGDGNGTRTTSISVSPINCSNSITYDADNPAIDPPMDGDMVYLDNTGSLVYGNNGCTVPPLNSIQIPKSYRSVVNPFSYSSSCDGDKYVQGVINYTGCTEVLTPVYSYTVICPDVVTRDTAICNGFKVDLSLLRQVNGGNNDVIVTYHSATPPGPGNQLPGPVVQPSVNTTYYVKADYLGRCSDVSAINVTVNPLPTAVANATPNPVCEGMDVNFTGSGGVNYLWIGPNFFFSILQNPTIPNVSIVNAGTYYLIVGNQFNCPDTATLVLSVVPGPTANATVDNNTICEGSDINLHATGAGSYSWSGPNGFTSTSADPVITGATVAASGTYSVTVTNASNCSDVASVLVTVNANPVATATADDTTLCVSNPLNLHVTGGGTYSWSGPNGFTSSSSDPSISSVDLPNGGLYTVTVTNGSGCTSTAAINVTVSQCACPDPPQVFAGNDTSLCMSSTPLVLNGWFTNAGSVTWTTSSADGSFSNINDPDATYYPGLDDRFNQGALLTLTTDDPDGPGPCEPAVDYMKVSFIPSGTTTLSGSLNLCKRECGGVRIISQGDTGPFRGYIDLHTGGLPIGDGYLGLFDVIDSIYFCYGLTDSIQFDTLTHTVYMPSWWNPVPVTATFDSLVSVNTGCSQAITGSISIQLAESPEVQITGNLYYCSGKRTTLSVPFGFDSYAWNNGATIYYISAGSPGTYSVTVTNDAGCAASDTVEVVQYPTPTVNIQGSTSYCAGSYTTLDAGAGFIHYEWTTGKDDQTINADQPGLYGVTVTDVNGCTGTATIIITERDHLTVDVVGDTAICPNQLTTLFATPGFAYYQWDNGGVADTIQVNQPGVYTVTVSDLNGCTGTADIIVTNRGDINVNISGSRTFCLGGYTILDAGDYDTYQWSNGLQSKRIQVNTPGVYTVTVTTSEGCSGTGSISVTQGSGLSFDIMGNDKFCTGGSTILDAGNYQTYNWNIGVGVRFITVYTPGLYIVTVTDQSGCIGVDSIVVTQIPALNVQIAGSLTFCPGSSTTLDAGAGYSTYLWSTGQNTRTVTITTPGVFGVTVTDANGCTGSKQVTVTQNNALVFSIIGDTTVCNGGTTVLDAGPGFNTYQWSTGDSSQTITANSSGQYSVTVSDAVGCSGTDDISITVSPPINLQINGSSTFCNGSNTTLDAGAGFSVYKWSTGATTQTITVNASGTYAVTVTDINGCTANSSLVVTEGSALTINILGDNSLCAGESTVLDPGSGFATYSWSTGASTQTITVNTPGTYSVTVSDSGSCTGSDNVTITVSAPVSVNISGNNIICTPGTSVLDAGPGFSSYLWSIGASSRTITVTTGGNYSVTVTNASGCTATDAFTVIQNPALSPVISGSTSFCSGSTTTLDAGGGFASYLWSDGSTTQTITTGIPGTYTVTVSDVSGCSGTDQVTITEGNALSIQIAGDSLICQATSTTLDAGGGFSSYVWSTGENTQTINVSTPGVYTVTVSDASGCSGSDSFSLDIAAPVSANIAGNLQFCTGTSTILDAGGGYSSYLWSNGSVTRMIVVNTSGTYSVTVTDANGCTANSSVVVTEGSALAVSISGDATICPTQQTTLDAGPGFASYLWSTGAISQTITVSAGATYEVTVTDANGCTGSASIVVTQYPDPGLAISGSTTFCTGNSTTLDAGGGYTSYLWSNGATSQTITTTVPGVYSVTITDGNSCQDIASVTISESDSLTISISGDAQICSGQTTVLNAGSGFDNYSWSDGSTSPTITVNASGTYYVTVSDNSGCSGRSSFTVNVVNSPTIIFDPVDTLCLDDPTATLSATPAGGTFSGTGVTGSVFNPANAGVGVHTITYTYISGPCTVTDSKDIFVKDCSCASTILVNAGIDQMICQDSTVLLSGSVNGSANNTWTTSGTGTFSDIHAVNPAYAPSAADYLAGLVHLYLTAADPDGTGPCSAVVDSLIIRFESAPVINTLSITQPDCKITTGSIQVSTAASPVRFSIDKGVSYSTNSTFAGIQPGFYELWAESANGCRTVDTFTIYPPLIFNPDWKILSPSCADIGTNTFVLSDVSLDVPVQVYLNNNLSATFTSLPGQIDSLANGTYSLRIVDANGCTKDSSFTFTEGISLDIDIQDLANIDQGQSIQLNPTINGTYATIIWTPATSLSCADCPNPVATPDSTITYFVRVNSKEGCEDMDSITIFVKPSVKIYVPNVFSPNRDGVNDVFNVYTEDNRIVVKQMEIYNRWGDHIFTKTGFKPNSDQGWDGSFKGKLLTPDVYVYYIILSLPDGTEKLLKGSITLIK